MSLRIYITVMVALIMASSLSAEQAGKVNKSGTGKEPEQAKDKAIPAKKSDVQIDPAFKALLAKMTDKEVIRAGDAAYEKNEFDKAKQCFLEIIRRENNNKKPDSRYLAMANYGMGRILSFYDKKFSEALPYLEKAVDYFQNSGIPGRQKANYFHVLGMTYYKCGNLKKALYYSEQAVLNTEKYNKNNSRRVQVFL